MNDLNLYSIIEDPQPSVQELLIGMFQPTMPCPHCMGKQVVCSGHINGAYIFNCWTCQHEWRVK